MQKRRSISSLLAGKVGLLKMPSSRQHVRRNFSATTTAPQTIVEENWGDLFYFYDATTEQLQKYSLCAP